MLSEGIQLFQSGRFAEAVGPLQRAVAADPDSGIARLMLAHPFLQLYYPPGRAPLDYQIVKRAQRDVEAVLAADPANPGALHALASLSMNRAAWEDAERTIRKLSALNSADAAAAFATAYIAYQRWHPAYEQALTVLGVSSEDPGGHTEPFLEPVRSKMRSTYEALLDRGMEHAQTALALYPRFHEAMAAMSLLIGARAYLQDTAEGFRRDRSDAAEWLRKAMEARR